MKKNKFILTLIWIWFLILLVIPKKHIEPVENLAVELGSGFDIISSIDNNYIYKVIRNVQIVGQNNKLTSKNYIGFATSMGKTRDERKTKMEKENLQGMEKVYIVSEKQADVGIKNVIDIIFRNPVVSDTAFFVVARGSVEDMLAYKIPGYVSSSDYIYGMIKNGKVNNFFSDNYAATDLYVRMDSEGKNVVVPCLDIDETGIYVWGFALFKESKLAGEMNIDEARVMNLLRENNVQGTVTIQKNSKEFIDFYCKTKKKVKCEKDKDKYKFTINLELKGDVVSNELISNLNTDTKAIAEFEKEMARNVERQCYAFIDKMKNDYKMDWIDLGKYAVAKGGRRTKTDWNKVVIGSEINVNVKVNLDKFGRGNY